MAFDGLVLKSLINEFDNKLSGLRIDKIYQPEKDEIVLSLRGFKETYKLFISADSNYPRINITENNFKNPDKPPLFCMLLRKHLASGKILSFSQEGSDRILKISVSSYNELGDMVEKHLIVEIMGRHSNIILIDEKNVIIDSIKRVDFTVSSKRQLLPGLLYESAPAQEKENFNSFDINSLREKLYSYDEINADSFLMDNFVGISPIVSREIAFKTFKTSKTFLLKSDLIPKADFLNNINNFFEKVSNFEFSPNILYDKESMPKFFSVVDLEQYGSLYKKVYIESPSKMIDLFYNDLHFARKIKLRSLSLVKTINNHIDKIRKKIEIHNDILLNKDKYLEYRLKGELLSANIYLIKGNEDKIKVFNYYDNSDILIDLDKTLSPAKNIDRYFKLYKKGQKAMEMALEQIEKAKKELYYLESELTFLENARSQKDIDDIKDELSKEGYIDNKKTDKGIKKQTKPECTTYITDEGFEILIGKNSRQNENITFKLSKGSDLWFHVKDYPGSHVVLKKTNKEFSDKAILKAAEFAACYSKDSNAKVAVDYTMIKFVKKMPGGKPGMVNYTNYKTIIVNKQNGEDLND